MGNAKSAEIKEPEKNGRKPKISVNEDSTKKSSTEKKPKNIHSARASMSSQGNRKPVLAAGQRVIIKYCIDNAKDDIADRIIRRAIERKDDFRFFMDNLQRSQRQEFSETLKEFLMKICENLLDSEAIQQMSGDFGASHVAYRPMGFKPDYFACTADAVTTECTFLDAATHGASDTAAAWSQLSSFVFSAVRDGYYAELRKQRKVSNAFRNRQSFDVSTDGSTQEESRRSLSPNDRSSGSQQEICQSEAPQTNFLLPPTVY